MKTSVDASYLHKKERERRKFSLAFMHYTKAYHNAHSQTSQIYITKYTATLHYDLGTLLKGIFRGCLLQSLMNDNTRLLKCCLAKQPHLLLLQGGKRGNNLAEIGWNN